jgi:aromatic-L-amino-acid decarboxylase
MIMNIESRKPPVEMSPEEFQAVGHKLVDQIAAFLATLPGRPVAPSKSPAEILSTLGDLPLPESGTPAEQLLAQSAELLFDNSTFNGHPRFLAYITSSATPIGALADLLAAAVNPNVGGYHLSPMASAIEGQTVRWIADLIGYPAGCGGLLVSGGNMANFGGFLAARRAKAGWDIRALGMRDPAAKQLTVYVSGDTHTWIEKAADLFGLGTEAIRWIPMDHAQRLDTKLLRQQIKKDLAAGNRPFLVVGTAGTTETGAVDPLVEIAAICKEYDLWFHVDGAYGAFAAALPDASEDMQAIKLADSVALDPHKWLYTPLEAGCTLVKDPRTLVDAFSYLPDYYHFTEDSSMAIDYYAYGMQNSRGFRALKVWLGLRQAGREGVVQMIQEDIELMRLLYELAEAHPELQPFTHNLSITTFRYLPGDLQAGTAAVDEYLNVLNTELLERLQHGGELFISNAVLEGAFLLRACVVNFRTSLADIEAIPEIVTRIGRQVDLELRPQALR